MREILFKAKTLFGEWIEGYYAVIGKRSVIIKAAPEKFYSDEMVEGHGNEVLDIDPETLCQYTGLIDKNGKKIWENDIVSNEWCFARGYSVVRFGEYKDLYMSCGNLGFYLEHMNDKDTGNTRKNIIYFAENYEVMGNVFDNPELV